jgi:hypothetical protein
VKKILLFAILLLSVHSYAQSDSTVNQKTKLSFAYLNIGGGAGITKGSTLGIGWNMIYSNHWGGSISYGNYNKKAKELPDDYQAGYPIGNENPVDELYSLSIRILREFPLSAKLIRFGVECGPSLILYIRAHFLYDIHGGGNYSNYGITYSYQYSAGLSLRAKAEFPLTRFLGLELAAISNINKYQSYVGVDLNLTLGYVRDRIKPKKR